MSIESPSPARLGTRGATAGWPQLGRRSLIVGVLAAVAMAAFYVVVVAGVSGSWTHLRDQIASDWYLLVLVVAGFATQMALLTELRRRHRLQAAVTAASGSGAGASAVGMIACCAHHIADLVPFLGASGVATFLYDYKVGFVVVGVGVNAFGIALATRRLRHTPVTPPFPAAPLSEYTFPTGIPT